MWRGALVLVALPLACARHEPECPAAYQSDAARAGRIRALLAEDPEGRPLLADGEPTSCFAAGAAGVTTGTHLFLDRDASDVRLAARMAHLLAHRKSAVSRTSGDPEDPDERPARALEARVFARLSAAHPE